MFGRVASIDVRADDGLLDAPDLMGAGTRNGAGSVSVTVLVSVVASSIFTIGLEVLQIVAVQDLIGNSSQPFQEPPYAIHFFHLN